MSCPTCSHTMQRVAGGVLWCPRCGTLAAEDAGLGTLNYEAPKLVERCREFEKTFPPGNPPSVSYSREWHRLGIAESIHPPEDRRKDGGQRADNYKDMGPPHLGGA